MRKKRKIDGVLFKKGDLVELVNLERGPKSYGSNIGMSAKLGARAVVDKKCMKCDESVYVNWIDTKRNNQSHGNYWIGQFKLVVKTEKKEEILIL